MFNFLFDRQHQGRPYPNLAPLVHARQEYQQLGNSWPWIAPCRLLFYTQDHSYPCNIYYVDQTFPDSCWYPIGLAWFDFNIDYFSMISPQILELVQQRRLKIMFYYHEGDSPILEKQRLDHLCQMHQLPSSSYCFVSGNTGADDLSNFVFFPDHELFYWRTGVAKQGTVHSRLRDRDFTMLSRVHKWWRLTAVGHLHQQGLLQNSFWSYGTVDVQDQYRDNPIELCQFPGLEKYINDFFARAPYTCDELTATEHNQHDQVVLDHFEDSYCNIVLETLYDAEQSGGTFLTEKTFKPIRHGQPFVIFGTVNSLATLRKLGYKTFDTLINNSYDQVVNNTDRFIKTVQAVQNLKSQDLHAWYQHCKDQCDHNRRLFLASKYSRLNNLHDKLLHQLATT